MDERFERLFTWLRQNGGACEKIEVRSITPYERSVFASVDLAPRQVILDVPENLLLTREKAYLSPMGQQILNEGLPLDSADALFAAYFLDTLQQDFWSPYREVLPATYPHIPIFYSESELKSLDGSAVAALVEEQRKSYLADDRLLRENIPAFQRFTTEQFFWARITLGSRSFAGKVGGERMDAMAPVLDLLNHRMPNNLDWACAPNRPHFRSGPPEPVRAGEELFVNYGVKSKRRSLLSWGFVTDDSDLDDAALALSVPDDVPLASAKRMVLLGGDDAGRWRRFFVSRPGVDLDGSELPAAIAFMRIAQASEEEFASIAPQGARLPNLGPISPDNELKAMRMLELACHNALSKFTTTVDEDEALLNGDLTANDRNCVMVRRGEKQVRQALIEYARTTASRLEQTPGTFGQVSLIQPR